MTPIIMRSSEEAPKHHLANAITIITGVHDTRHFKKMPNIFDNGIPTKRIINKPNPKSVKPFNKENRPNAT